MMTLDSLHSCKDLESQYMEATLCSAGSFIDWMEVNSLHQGLYLNLSHMIQLNLKLHFKSAHTSWLPCWTAGLWKCCVLQKGDVCQDSQLDQCSVRAAQSFLPQKRQECGLHLAPLNSRETCSPRASSFLKGASKAFNFLLNLHHCLLIKDAPS